MQGINDFMMHRRNATEYFICENRQQAGRDAGLPDAGLAIWHVDELGNNSNEQMTPASHYELSLEQRTTSSTSRSGSMPVMPATCTARYQ
jgi:hypothetical protein